MRRHSDFSGLPLNELIIKPLVGAAIAQGRIAEEQVRSLLEYCFYHDGNDYKPKMLKMSVTRGVLEPESLPDKAEIHQVTSFFNLPLVTIFPFSSLGVETVNIEFDMEVTAQYAVDTDTDIETKKSSGNNDSDKIWRKNNPSIEILGKIAQKRSSVQNSSKNLNQSERVNVGPVYAIDIAAGPIPLTKGLLNIIDIYTKAITPVEILTEK